MRSAGYSVIRFWSHETRTQTAAGLRNYLCCAQRTAHRGNLCERSQILSGNKVSSPPHRPFGPPRPREAGERCRAQRGGEGVDLIRTAKCPVATQGI
jgi:hypothetical protein